MLLLTGASGYIGRALLPRLLDVGFTVITAGRAPVVDGVDHRSLDLANPVLDAGIFDGVTQVIHCAGIAHNGGAAEDYNCINTDATAALGVLARDNGCRQFINLSSLNVVSATADRGDQLPDQLAEPAGTYARSKWMAEKLLVENLAGSPCALTIIRPGLVYDLELVANLALLRRLSRWLPVKLPDTGGRGMIARPDLVELILKLALADPPCGKEPVDARVVVATDGECYTSRRIGEAFSSSDKLPLPPPGWRLAAYCWDILRGTPPGATWMGIAGSHWCGATVSRDDWEPRYTLERLLTARVA